MGIDANMALHRLWGTLIYKLTGYLESAPGWVWLAPKPFSVWLESNVEILMGLIKILIYLAILVGCIVFFAILINFAVRFF